MADRIVGILGGMGPEATLDLYREIIRLTPADRDQDHIRVLIYSNPKIPDRTRAIVCGEETPLPMLVESARVLESGGAGIIAIPCNAAHYFLSDLRTAVGIPILNMIEETCRALKSSLAGIQCAGLLAATGTVRSAIYHKVFEALGVRLLSPDAADQDRVQKAIERVKAGAHDQTTCRTFQEMGASLIADGAEAVILGCTEIPLAFQAEGVDYTTLNPTRVLAQRVVEWALKDET